MSATNTLPQPTPPGPRLRAAGLVLAAALLLHWAAFSLLERAPGPGWRAEPARALSVRRIARPAATGAPPNAKAPQAVPARAGADANQTHDETPAAAPAVDAAATEVPAPVAAAAPAEAQPDPGGLQVPVYATVLPAPAVLRFESRRALASGVAELSWQRGDEGYRLSLQGQALGAPFIGWVSQGGMDDAGLAPVRYAESRRGREVRAVNFQRDSGRVSFSGPNIEHPLVPGMQDRLSWLIQLGAVLQANPGLAAPGAQLQMAVVGTRGDAEVWTFSVVGRQALDLPSGAVAEAVHLLREPRRPYDTQVQVWLDPARGHLPVQAFLRVRATGEGTELRLMELRSP